MYGPVCGKDVVVGGNIVVLTAGTGRDGAL
jgi:hypothetical protein